jgi:ankyrin repeat protein
MALICANNTVGNLTVFSNNGAGLFTPQNSWGVGNSPECVVAVDVNGDSKPDLITANYGDGTLSILTNNGAGLFSFSTTNIFVGTNVDCLQAVDINGDGKLDLVCGTSQAILVLTNNGHGTFATYATVALTSPATSVVVADFNGDGKLDLACAEGYNNSVQIFTNNGSGGFGINTTLMFTTLVDSLTVADVNGDNLNDLITANANTPGTLTVLTQAGAARPVLKISRPALNSIVVSWASSSSSFVLQTNKSLATTNWVPVTLTGTNQSVTLTPPPPGTLYFRLQN